MSFFFFLWSKATEVKESDGTESEKLFPAGTIYILPRKCALRVKATDLCHEIAVDHDGKTLLGPWSVIYHDRPPPENKNVDE